LGSKPELVSLGLEREFAGHGRVALSLVGLILALSDQQVLTKAKSRTSVPGDGLCGFREAPREGEVL